MMMAAMESSEPASIASHNSLGQRMTMFFCCSPASDEDERPLSPCAAGSSASASSSWIRSVKAHELPDLGDKYRSLVAGIKRRHLRRHHCAGPFRYDPVSYAQNFDDMTSHGEDDELVGGGGASSGFLYGNFSSRLPASPSAAATRLRWND